MHIYMYKPFWTHIKRGQGPIKKPYKHALGGGPTVLMCTVTKSPIQACPRGANSSAVHCNKKTSKKLKAQNRRNGKVSDVNRLNQIQDFVFSNSAAVEIFTIFLTVQLGRYLWYFRHYSVHCSEIEKYLRLELSILSPLSSSFFKGIVYNRI